MIEWLLSPISPDRIHDVGYLVSWHGRLMVLAWSVLVPIGILVARFFKIIPGQDWPNSLDNPTWWHAHRIFQWSAFALALAALALILPAPTQSGGSMHAILGWTASALLIFQVASGLLRGSKGGPTDPDAGPGLSGSHYYMTRRRRVFEIAHKSAGYAAWAVSLIATLLGLWSANAPVWMCIVLPLWWLLLLVVFFIFQRQGRAVDTYQAIWGPDPSLPGNRRRPIGIGIRKRAE